MLQLQLSFPFEINSSESDRRTAMENNNRISFKCLFDIFRQLNIWSLDYPIYRMYRPQRDHSRFPVMQKCFWFWSSPTFSCFCCWNLTIYFCRVRAPLPAPWNVVAFSIFSFSNIPCCLADDAWNQKKKRKRKIK